MELKFKEEAIKLRRQSLTYSEILKFVPVAKSTLSLWLRSVNLTRRQEQKLTRKKLASIRRGGAAKKYQRIQKAEQIRIKSKNEVKSITNKELWLIGVALYWAEGAKAKEHNVSQGVEFSNTDSLMIKLFLHWLKDALKVKDNQIKFAIYIHENSKNNIKDVMKYWSEVTNYPLNKFGYVYFKKHKIKTNRKNIGSKYYGILRIKLRRSTDLNRKISGWTEGILENCGVV